MLAALYAGDIYMQRNAAPALTRSAPTTTAAIFLARINAATMLSKTSVAGSLSCTSS